MEYSQLKEMPRFWLQYSIKFFNDANKTKILELLNDKMFNNKDFIFECLYEENETFSINLEFADFLFCGFSCSDAITYMFSEEIIVKIEKIISEYESNIKEISLSIECYDNIFATRYYMHTDIVGKAADIVHRIKPDIYFQVGKDGFYSVSELKEVCMKVCGIDINNFENHDALIEQIKLEIKKLMKNKTENYKEIILLRYALRCAKRLRAKKIMWNR